MAAAGSHVDGAVRSVLATVVPRLAAAHQLAALGHRLDRSTDLIGVAEEGELGLAERHFPGGAA